MSTLAELSSWLTGLRKTTLRLAAEEVKEETSAWEQDGVNVSREFFYGHWNGSDTRWRILLDGFDFALERQSIGGLLGGGISTWYWVWIDLPRLNAEACLREAGFDSGKHLMEEFYPTENGPERWNACFEDFDDVLRLWKVWDSKYRMKPVGHEISKLRGSKA